ncbi:MAG: UDP-N-acetylglucosamine 2-epimerase (non-hydrolyzing) [Phycisphaerales bacterium]|nr:UDP-N-acetylglucosamine 2-epimerase (non-hydrolyzing) [Phycisphaerales bacterium]MCB9855027.1 UDP-N-acetylglucosamine 2-epimerase (non-hydrolyzing) [Phycisphaerales bacterium]MCB9863456.1 UDP-N-acetylglucosamine 2-epimerase (non-hydrolyzing) [Phycisphaerales bacterium]
MKILSIVGARPQFVKAAPLSKAIRRGHEEILVHTGQHYDDAMSRVFFEGLDLPEPDVNLGVGSGSHAEQTARMLVGIERLIQDHRPHCVLVYGDTNSTLAGALAASKLGLPLVHVEAGLRSFNRTMPEEINRILTDRVSTLLLCPTQTAVDNLRCEGIDSGVHLVGDVMFDAAAWAARRADSHSDVIDRLGLSRGDYLLATVHRASNTDDVANLSQIVEAFVEQDRPIVWPVHPRSRKTLAMHGLLARLEDAGHVMLIEPLGYLDFVALTMHAAFVLTDSGGVQKEACFHRTPCITLRDETEWVETVRGGWNRLVGSDKARILAALATPFAPPTKPVDGDELWDGRASERICDSLQQVLGVGPTVRKAVTKPVGLTTSDRAPITI